MKDYGFQRDQFPARIEFDLDGAMKSLLRAQTGGLGAGLIASNLVAAKSVELFQRMLDDPVHNHGGFEMRMRHEQDGLTVTGQLRERRIEVECPYCSCIHRVPGIGGTYRLACRTLRAHPFSIRGKEFTVFVDSSERGLEIVIHRF